MPVVADEQDGVAGVEGETREAGSRDNPLLAQRLGCAVPQVEGDDRAGLGDRRKARRNRRRPRDVADGAPQRKGHHRLHSPQPSCKYWNGTSASWRQKLS